MSYGIDGPMSPEELYGPEDLRGVDCECEGCEIECDGECCCFDDDPASKYGYYLDSLGYDDGPAGP